jgi:hypothetical protein
MFDAAIHPDTEVNKGIESNGCRIVTISTSNCGERFEATPCVSEAPKYSEIESL